MAVLHLRPPIFLLRLLLVTGLVWGLPGGEPGRSCLRRCHRILNRTEGTDFDVRCNNSCKIEQCTRGCQLWKESLESSCQDVCNGIQEVLPEDEIYCMMGCNFAVNSYIQQLKDEIGTPPPPALVADSLTNVSLSLEWGGSHHSNVAYLLQWRYASLPGTWQYFADQVPKHNTTKFIDCLRPYTKYIFRVAWLLAPDREPLMSRPSVVISTMAYGPPSAPPALTTVAAVDATRVSVAWTPSPFPNGPVLSYVLQIRELPAGYSTVKDVPASEENLFYLFSGLKPGTNYSVSVATRNSAGEGPADVRVVTTPPHMEAVKDSLEPHLILGARQTIIRQGLDLFEGLSVIYNSTREITGVAVHVSKKLLFVSDSAGYIIISTLGGQEPPTTLLTPAHMGFSPSALSVDWLNNHLYILGKVVHSSGSVWQISRCYFDGKGLTNVMPRLPKKPLHFEVDPFNGNLYWVLVGVPNGGLYKLDLADVATERKNREVQPELILEDHELGAFAVDHMNFRLLVSHQTQNTVISVSLDGSDVMDIRDNTQQPRFQKVLSMVTYNGLFYWTNGQEVIGEEYFPQQDSYFHNSYPYLSSDKPFNSISLFHPDAQPVPMPVNAPRGVQAIFSSEVAKVMWKPPQLLGGIGKGAWQNWLYEMHITEVNVSRIIYSRDINTTLYTVHNLKENTEYAIKVLAYSSAGKGPWSPEFRGHTLKATSEGKYPVFLWSAHDGLLKTDILGDNVETLVHKVALQDGNERYHIMDITWYKDALYLVLNNSQVVYFNMTSRKAEKMDDIDSAGSIAVDWIGHKLYWSSPKHQLITRANLNGSYQEPLPIITVARELNVDAVSANIYWSTGHSVECAKLHGGDQQVYYQAGLFSGKQVMGLTLDSLQQDIYWMVRSYEGSVLFRAPTVPKATKKLSETIEEVSNLQHAVFQGPLRCFGNHLVWLQDEDKVIIADMQGQNAAVLSSMGLTDLKTVGIVDYISRVYPEGTSESTINVIPNPISASSLEVIGNWESFLISWDPVTNVNYGQVFYEIKLEGEYPNQSVVTDKSQFAVESASVPHPYSVLQVVLRAFTYWGSSQRTVAKLRSPPGPPSVVRHPRVFVSFRENPMTGNKGIMAEFRWDEPYNCNGIIRGYRVKCWLEDTPMQQCEDVVIPGSQHHLIVEYLYSNSTYYFQVQAYTDGGEGPFSAKIMAQSGVEMPVPKLLIATQDAVKITDIDKKENTTLSRNTVPPVDLAYIGFENKFFWINEGQQLMCSMLDGTNKTRIFTVNGTGHSITVDWIGRYLYWAETNEESGTSAIYRLDLNQDLTKQHPDIVVKSNTDRISSVGVEPLTSQLFWTANKKSGIGALMTSNADGSNPRRFFQRKRRTARSETGFPCTCPDNPAVGKVLSVDHADPDNPRVLWVDGWQNHVFMADIHGCHCTVVVNATIHPQIGLPPSSMTADHGHVYWSNSSLDRVYFIQKPSTKVGMLIDGVSTFPVRGIKSVSALGDHLQPYPVLRCLIPEQQPQSVTLHAYTANSITLRMPASQRSPSCQNVSLASVRYTLHYGMVGAGGQSDCTPESVEQCQNLTTYKKIQSIAKLQAFSDYVFYLSSSNYYSDLLGVEPIVGFAVIVKTAAGAPYQPRNLTVEPVTPSAIHVKWLPPSKLNGQSVWYEVHWGTQALGGIKQKGEQQLSPQDQRASHDNNDQWTFVIQNLLPSQIYSVWVRAYSENGDAYNDTREVSVHTYPEPSNITLLETTSTSLNVSWSIPSDGSIVSCVLQYQELAVKRWYEADPPTGKLVSESLYYLADGLKPKTQYIFRLNLTYENSRLFYVWPNDARFTYETLGKRPGPPGTPVIRMYQKDIYEIMWEPSEDNGGRIEVYVLEYRLNHRDREKRETVEENKTKSKEETTISNEWQMVYNGSENKWLVTGLSSDFRYVFRVQSKNEYGWSDYSELSQPFDFTAAALIADEQELGLVLGTAIPIILVLGCVCGGIIFIVFRKREKEKKAQQVAVTNSTPRPDLELATLRELPQHSSFVHQNNALYTVADITSDEEITALPFIRRDQITLTKFLGSGAFGEVFEGVAQSLPGFSEPETRVAIKTLRKGASEQEKVEFLKEAQLMSNFKHEHIISLLGVCLDNDPIFILLELMEGGDLLSYLRNNRPTQSMSSAHLSLLDLLDICVDVARGCCYLEEMHFVHRDLACRNCLVSSSDPVSRIVKIGDFGLARDIYKNDYYRKEGEGLLPVRWMSPESLVDGVFTCQSDVWAFGVLLWEIMTMGQQPYPARTNLEVLHYVRNGGRLDQPGNCPEDLHHLMMKCWSYSQEERPTFKYCLEQLEELREKCATAPVTSVHNGQYIGHMPDGAFDNPGFFHDDKYFESSGSSWKTNHTGSDNFQLQCNGVIDDGAGVSGTQLDAIPYADSISDTATLPFSSLGSNGSNQQEESRAIPQYLELLSETDAPVSPTGSDGYEVPRVSTLERAPHRTNYLDLRCRSHSASSPEPVTISDSDYLKPDEDGHMVNGESDVPVPVTKKLFLTNGNAIRIQDGFRTDSEEPSACRNAACVGSPRVNLDHIPQSSWC